MSECVFCRIVAGEAPAAFVHRDDEVVAFHDVAPRAPVHLLLVPVRHIESLSDASDQDLTTLGRILLLARDLAAKENLDKSGYRVVTNTGRSVGQSVFHLHFHLLGGRPMSWPPG